MHWDHSIRRKSVIGVKVKVKSWQLLGIEPRAPELQQPDNHQSPFPLF